MVLMRSPCPEITLPLPPDAEDIAFAPLTHLSHWVRSGQISSLELTNIYLSRIEALNPKLECFATVTPDLARAEAAAMDSLLSAGVWLGPLHGIPYGLKDLFDTKGITTGWGAEPFQNRVPDSDAAVTTKLRAAGGRVDRQDHNGRAGLQRSVVRRLDAQPLEPERGVQRVQRRIRLCHRSRAVRLFHRD